MYEGLIGVVEKIEKAMGGVNKKTLAILGLAFKPETDDIREAPSIYIIEELSKKGAKVDTHGHARGILSFGLIKIFDPRVIEKARKKFQFIKKIVFCNDKYEAIEGADAIVIITEWNQLRSLDFSRMKKIMKDNYFYNYKKYL
ncbi:MAG: hypothetical protein IBV53_09860 [Candidatus Atribacteria bacterium]